MSTVIEKSGLLSEDELYKIVAPVIIELFDEKILDPRVSESVAEKLGFTDFEVVNKEGQIKTKLGLKGAPLVGEFDEFELSSEKYGPKISYDTVRTYIGSGMSSKTKLWLERVSSASGISADLIEDIKSALSGLEDRAYEIAIAENEYLTKCFTEGFDITSDFGPGSAVYDGKSLFSDEHKIVGTGATYSNIVSYDDNGTEKHSPLTFAALKQAIGMHRTMKDGLGIRVRRADIYDLIVAPELEGTALDILSDSNGFSPYNYTGGEATNDNFTNIFMTRDGFKVRLVVLDTLNQPDSQDPSKTIGTDKVWFVLNKSHAGLRKALRKLNFGGIKLKMFEDDRNGATFMTAEKFFGAQALYPEIVVGSKGDNSAV